jgi:hypothetical protein
VGAAVVGGLDPPPEGGGASSLRNRMNTSVTQMRPSPPRTTPTPMRVKSGSTMLARCGGEFMNAAWICGASPPTPTFSPSFFQSCVTSLDRFGLCDRRLSAAIFADHRRAIDVSSESTDSARERSPFVSDTN